MKWFKEKHPALFVKYSKHIGMPFRENGGITILSSIDLSAEDLDLLTRIAHSYYDEQPGKANYN